ncbi:MAG: amino acid adenylation domain-containing protein [Pseudomonadota bacterium]
MNSHIGYSTIQQLFQLQVQKTPDNIALIFGELKVSYQQLDLLSNSLAAILKQHEVKEKDIVGIHMDRHPNVIIVMLAILKCGAAYLPLDKVNPYSRNRSHVDDCQVKLVITDVDNAAPNPLAEQQLFIDKRELYRHVDEDMQTVQGTSEDVAYVMFTSGSTGKPKGVVVAHKGIRRLVIAQDYIAIDSQDKILQFSSLSFDAATFEIWGALLNGATLVLYSGDGLDPNHFKDEINSHSVTIVFMTTALFHLIANRFIRAFSGLKYLLTGGDVLYPRLVNKVADTYPQLHLIICYGPTENTTFTTTHPITNDNRPDSNVPIGKAIRGTQVHLLNEDFRPCEVGEEGELFTSGEGVALGYLNRSYSLAEFFMDETIAPGVIYRTGDIVRRNHKDELEFVGRKDNQIKIRGFRASIEEIQKTVNQLTSVKDAIVVIDKYDNGDQQLVAYIQLQEGIETTSGLLRKQLLAVMPNYMVPDRLIIKKDFPINKNGKICRATLKAEFVEQKGMKDE